MGKESLGVEGHGTRGGAGNYTIHHGYLTTLRYSWLKQNMTMHSPEQQSCDGDDHRRLMKLACPSSVQLLVELKEYGVASTEELDLYR